MSNTEPLADQPAPAIDDLACSINENLVISSSDQEKSSQASLPDKTMSDVDSQVKETDNQPSKDKDFHLIKWIEFNFERLPILLQNVNGPCPLLAIFNILLLRKRVKSC
jgi:hypothetical protein